MSLDKQVSAVDKSALAAFDALCQMLDESDWHYEKDEAKLQISCGAQGDDLPIPLQVTVYPDFQLISLISPMPFTVPEDRRKELAVAISRANNGLVDGSFDYDYTRGYIVFRLTSSFRGGLVGKELMHYMVMVSCGTVDEYNDKFEAVCKNGMTADEIVEYIK